MSAHAARAMPTGSTPPCSKKSRSSAASTASCMTFGHLVEADLDPVLAAVERGHRVGRRALADRHRRVADERRLVDLAGWGRQVDRRQQVEDAGDAGDARAGRRGRASAACARRSLRRLTLPDRVVLRLWAAMARRVRIVAGGSGGSARVERRGLRRACRQATNRRPPVPGRGRARDSAGGGGPGRSAGSAGTCGPGGSRRTSGRPRPRSR